MTKDEYFYEPGQGHGLAHNPFKAIIAPRPIGWISSLDAQGIPNLAPYSFFNAFSMTPPIIGFASEGYKDTVRNIEATGEFCWNLATRPLAEKMNASSASVTPDVDEFALAGLTKGPSRLVSAPRVAETPVSFECRRTGIIRLQNALGAEIDTWLVLGEVVGVHIDKTFVKEGVYQTRETAPILRAGGLGSYLDLGAMEMFEMQRPA